MLVAREYEEVTQIKLSRRAESTAVSAYLVDGLLVDTGLAHTAAELADFLRARKVSKVVNTHYHEDHIGANHILTAQFHLQLYAHGLAVDRVSQPARLYPYQEEVWGYPVPTHPGTIGASIATALFRFEMIHTPGHSPDHICLFERRQGWLFSGDLFHSTHPGVARPEEDQWQILDSLRKIQALQPRVLFTAPSNIVTEPERVLGETIGYLEQLGERITDLRDGGLSPAQIRQTIFGEENPLAMLTQAQFSSLNLVLGFTGPDASGDRKE